MRKEQCAGNGICTYHTAFLEYFWSDRTLNSSQNESFTTGIRLIAHNEKEIAQEGLHVEGSLGRCEQCPLVRFQRKRLNQFREKNKHINN